MEYILINIIHNGKESELCSSSLKNVSVYDIVMSEEEVEINVNRRFERLEQQQDEANRRQESLMERLMSRLDASDRHMHDELARRDAQIQEALVSRDKALRIELDENRRREDNRNDPGSKPDPFVYSSTPINREASHRARRPSPSFRSADSFRGAHSASSAHNASVVVVQPTPWRSTYGGEKKDDINTFLNQFDCYVELQNMDDRAAVKTLIVSLRDDAARTALNLPRDSTFAEVKDALRERFDNVTTPMSSSLKFKNALRKKDESARAFADRLRKIARKAFPLYEEVATELRVLEQFQDGQMQHVKEMLAHHEFRTMNECILAVTRYEDKARGYGLHRNVDTPRHDPDRAQGARRADDSYENTWYADATKTHVPPEDDLNVLIRRMCDKWVDPALAEVTFDENGMFNDEEIFSILQTNVDPSTPASSCFFCKKRGHGWRKCFRLRNILQANGMKGNGPFPANTRANPTTKAIMPKPIVDGNSSN